MFEYEEQWCDCKWLKGTNCTNPVCAICGHSCPLPDYMTICRHYAEACDED